MYMYVCAYIGEGALEGNYLSCGVKHHIHALWSAPFCSLAVVAEGRPEGAVKPVGIAGDTELPELAHRGLVEKQRPHTPNEDKGRRLCLG